MDQRKDDAFAETLRTKIFRDGRGLGGSGLNRDRACGRQFFLGGPVLQPFPKALAAFVEG